MLARPTLVLSFLSLISAGCSSATVQPESAAASESATPASENAETAAPSETGAPSEAAHGKRAPCTLGADQSCNEDPKVSALWGHCTELGVCECKVGFERSPTSDLCRPVQ